MTKQHSEKMPPSSPQKREPRILLPAYDFCIQNSANMHKYHRKQKPEIQDYPPQENISRLPSCKATYDPSHSLPLAILRSSLCISPGLGSRIKPHARPQGIIQPGITGHFPWQAQPPLAERPEPVLSSFLFPGRYVHHSAVQPKEAALSFFRQLLSDTAQHSVSQQNREPLAMFRAEFVIS